MPGVLIKDAVAGKRKRDDHKAQAARHSGPRKAVKASSGEDTQAQILDAEQALLHSREQYARFDQLFALVAQHDTEPKTAIFAAVSLCRVFCRLIAAERLVESSALSPADKEDVHLFKAKLRQYVRSICQWIGSPDAAKEDTAVSLLMRIVKEQVSQPAKRAEQAWRTPSSPFWALIKALLNNTSAEGARHLYAETYVEEYDDVRYFTLLAVKQLTTGQGDSEDKIVDNALDLLLQIEGIPESQAELEDWFGTPPQPEKHFLLSLTAHRKAGQDAWLEIFRASLTHEQRKRMLDAMTVQILPWFSNKLELLTDFLTNSFNTSGSTAVLALSGLFHLITKHNIDYPDFYNKLYSLLNEDILHSKHRNRFLRLLDSCLSSTHLPAALVASFTKRLARLALQAPPGAIVWLIPFTYNILRQHPSCTFMLHRAPHPAHYIYSTNSKYEVEGMEDPFSMSERDPMLTRAIDSSLWELETLRSHYHPNVATLAGIIAEQFTKREYQMEDFLDHTYASLIDAEVGKDLKKAPVVEFEIPKHIITAEGAGTPLNTLGQLLSAAVGAMC